VINEVGLRLGFFLGIVILVAVWESVSTKRALNYPKKTRWVRNILLVFIDSIAVKVLLPFTAASVAIYAQAHHIGLFHSVSIPPMVAVFVSIIVLDLIIYVQHRLFHSVPVFWRLHQVHHIDQDIDVTTGLRFHPLEIILSIVIKSAAVLAFGIPFWAIVSFEILLNGTAMFNHGNIKLSPKFDALLRLILVTPDMHRVHHSVVVREMNSNFGFNLPIWDRLFGTYIDQPAGGHLGMTIGLNAYPDAKKTGLINVLILPFQKTKK
jgi:sterol desaturase/sphingolipid hydroxylase (fatty acid hydroxylase superfamily)